jgi:hypothetical protein
MNQQRRAKFVDGFYKLFAAALLVTGREQAPFGTRTIKSEIDELSGKLRLLYFHIRSRRGKPKRTAGGISWILIATHCFNL